MTYNRKDLLLECLDGLFRQTRPIDGLVLIDNASTDGTADALYAQKLLPELPPTNDRSVWEFRQESRQDGERTFVYLRLPVNEGGSGGFHEGVKKALEFDCDWLWMMDDDVEPEEGCLQGQLAFSEISKCIHPRKYFQDGLAHEWEGYISPVTGRRIFQPDISFRKGFSFCTVNTGCFEGMLIHRSVVEKIGLPDKRFFLGGGRFGLRISRPLPHTCPVSSGSPHQQEENLSGRKQSDCRPEHLLRYAKRVFNAAISERKNGAIPVCPVFLHPNEICGLCLEYPAEQTGKTSGIPHLDARVSGRVGRKLRKRPLDFPSSGPGLSGSLPADFISTVKPPGFWQFLFLLLCQFVFACFRTFD